MEKPPPAYVEPSITHISTSEKSRLCDVCRELDIAELLSQAENQTSTKMLTALDAVHNEEMEFKPSIPLSFEHHKSLEALEVAAEHGCTLCALIWKCWSESPGRSSKVDRAIDDAGKAQIYIGTSGYNISKAEMPLITVIQKPDGNSRTLCTLDVYTERGKPTLLLVRSGLKLTCFRFHNLEIINFHRHLCSFSLRLRSVQSDSCRVVRILRGTSSSMWTFKIISTTHETHQRGTQKQQSSPSP